MELSRTEKEALYDMVTTAHSGGKWKGATVRYTSHNGHMYSMLTKDNEVAVRLPVADRENFLEKYKTKLLQQYGIIQKEYVVVPENLLKKTKELLPYFEISFGYVSSLKPKATKRG